MHRLQNKLRVCHYPQIPCSPFCVDVKDEYEAYSVINLLAAQHLFLYENDIIGDYSNVLTVEMWESDLDGEGNSGWTSYFNEEELMNWEELVERYL